MQLEERQKLKAVYGMLSQKQLVNAYKKARIRAGNTSHNFIDQLECRLDNVVYRLRFSNTIFGAQQLVSHGHIQVNGKKVDRRSFLVRPGMTISIKSASRQMKAIQASQENTSRDIPEYLALEDDKSIGKLMTIPHLDQIPLPIPINIPLVCESLSHTN